ncbi:MAG TPA: transglycosylase SLT domain-containing protein [Cytophagaceae bacterium]
MAYTPGMFKTLILFFISSIVTASIAMAQTEELEEMIDEVEEIVEVEEVEELLEVSDSEVQHDFIPNVPDELIADRLSCLEKEIQLTFNSRIRSFIDYFTVKNRKYAQIMERRKQVYFPIFEEYLAKYNMPDELKYLAIVESGLNPKAISRAGAAGLWQFMPATGKQYGLTQNAYIDERLDPYKSTEAACKYLKDLYRMFGDWELALASYNCGPGNVRRAIRKSGYKDSFWGIYNFLPVETRGYVPQFVALTYVMNHLNDHNIYADSLEYPMDFDTIHIQQYVNLELLCEELNICMEDVMKLNPALKKSYIPENLNYALRIPSDVTTKYALNKVHIMDVCSKRINEPESAIASSEVKQAPQQQRIIYTVKKGDVLSKIAERHGVGLSQVKAWNKMKNTTIYPGQKLVIYKSGDYFKTSTSQTVAKSSSSTGQKPIPKYHYVQPGDTLWTISRKYDGLTIEKIKKLNNLKSSEIKAGQKLKLS